MPVGRPRLTDEEKRLREQAQKSQIWKCKGCGRELSRSQWYKHRRDDCGRPAHDQHNQDLLKRTYEAAFSQPVASTSSMPESGEPNAKRSHTEARLNQGSIEPTPGDTSGLAHHNDKELHLDVELNTAQDNSDNEDRPSGNIIEWDNPLPSSPPLPPADRGSLEDLAAQEDELSPDAPAPIEGDHPDPQANPAAEEQPRSNLEPTVIHLQDLKNTQDFIERLRNASLEEDHLHPAVVERLRNPLTHELRIDNPGERCSVEFYLQDTSEANYAQSCDTIRRVYKAEPLTYAQVKSKVRDMSGIHPVYDDMCITGCYAYVGPFAKFSRCPKCSEHRYDQHQLQTTGKKVPRQQFVTLPVGPQIQAAYRSADSAENMRYRANRTRELLESLGVEGEITTWSDYIDGTAYLEAVNAEDIDDTTSVLMGSLDGAQLYRMKASDCWVYIWVLLDRPPDSRYKKKHVLIGGVIPGPNKPSNIDSYLFPGLYHISALMNDGFKIWDAKRDLVFLSRPFLAFVTADGPGMTEVNGLVGHSGAQGCRLYCAMQGRHKPNVGIYYPVCLKPVNYFVDGCTHNDINLASVTSPESQATTTDRYEQNLQKVLSSTSATAYRQNRLATGIGKPSLLRGLRPDSILSVPGCFPADLMHLGSINLPDLLLGLWCGTIACDANLGDDKGSWDWAVFRDTALWKEHGKQVASATPYLPGSFDRPPRNPAEKLHSGYKAMEFLTYIYGLGPGLLYSVLPMPYWKNFCKLVRGVRIVSQKLIEKKELMEADRLLLDFCIEFEKLYYQRQPSRIHFVRQSIHALAHIATETTRIGPYAGVTQWTMENTIGNLGREVRQHSNAFANLAQRAVRRCQINAIKAMLPELDPPKPLPRNAEDLSNGYILLHKHDPVPRPVSPAEAAVLREFTHREGIAKSDDWRAHPTISRWGRLRLPNGQIARSLWIEARRPLSRLRMSRNIKIVQDSTTKFGEVRYYLKMQHPLLGERTYAMVNIYGDPDADLLEQSSHTLWSCTKQAENIGLRLVDIANIRAVVAMVPHAPLGDPGLGDFSQRVFVVEKIGLDVLMMGGDEEDIEDDADDADE